MYLELSDRRDPPHTKWGGKGRQGKGRANRDSKWWRERTGVEKGRMEGW